MNIKLAQLVQQATEQVKVSKWDEENHCSYKETEFRINSKKLAELIVTECAKVGEEVDGNQNVKQEILNHFGLN